MRGLHSLSGVANERKCAEDWIHFSSDQKQALPSSGDQLARAHEIVLPLFIYRDKDLDTIALARKDSNNIANS